MAADDAQVFSAIAQCFAPTTDEAWTALTQNAEWDGILSGARNLVSGARPLGCGDAPIARAHRAVPLSEFLTEQEIQALFVPPPAEEKHRFAAQHFTGGLPQSALPVESLYRTWASEGMFAGERGMYNSEVARYMRDLTASLGLEVPASFSACPDHLAIELEVAAVLIDAGRADEARQFFVERFDWLTSYRLKLIELGEEAVFYVALVDLLIGIRAGQLPYEETAGANEQ